LELVHEDVVESIHEARLALQEPQLKQRVVDRVPIGEAVSPALLDEYQVVSQSGDAVDDLDAIRSTGGGAAWDPRLDVLVQDREGELVLLEPRRVLDPGRREQTGELLAGKQLVEHLAAVVLERPVAHLN